jgi:hypothetical protein
VTSGHITALYIWQYVCRNLSLVPLCGVIYRSEAAVHLVRSMEMGYSGARGACLWIQSGMEDILISRASFHSLRAWMPNSSEQHLQLSRSKNINVSGYRWAAGQRSERYSYLLLTSPSLKRRCMKMRLGVIRLASVRRSFPLPIDSIDSCQIKIALGGGLGVLLLPATQGCNLFFLRCCHFFFRHGSMSPFPVLLPRTFLSGLPDLGLSCTIQRQWAILFPKFGGVEKIIILQYYYWGNTVS